MSDQRLMVLGDISARKERKIHSNSSSSISMHTVILCPLENVNVIMAKFYVNLFYFTTSFNNSVLWREHEDYQ